MSTSSARGLGRHHGRATGLRAECSIRVLFPHALPLNFSRTLRRPLGQNGSSLHRVSNGTAFKRKAPGAFIGTESCSTGGCFPCSQPTDRTAPAEPQSLKGTSIFLFLGRERAVRAEDPIKPRYVLRVVTSEYLVVHIVVAHLEDVWNVHGPARVIQRGHQRRDDKESGSAVDMRGDQVKAENVVVKPRDELERVSVDAVDSAARGRELLVMVLVNIRVDRREVERPVEPVVDPVIDGQLEERGRERVPQRNSARLPAERSEMALDAHVEEACMPRARARARARASLLRVRTM